MPIAQRHLDGRGRRDRVRHRTGHYFHRNERRLRFLLISRTKAQTAMPRELKVRVDVVATRNLRGRYPRSEAVQRLARDSLSGPPNFRPDARQGPRARPGTRRLHAEQYNPCAAVPIHRRKLVVHWCFPDGYNVTQQSMNSQIMSIFQLVI